MEIEIDEKVFGEVASREYAVAVSEIKKAGWRRSLASTQKRNSEISATILAGSTTKVACKANCWYCCYYKVDVCAQEVFSIVDYVRAKFSTERAKRLRYEVASNAKVMRRLSHADQLSINLKCPFLEDGNCSIYEVRPVRCRNFHATDVEGCKKSYEEPTNLTIQNSYVPELYTALEAQTDGYKKAMADSGYDISVYELNSALTLALTDSVPRRRFEKGKRAFTATIAR